MDCFLAPLVLKELPHHFILIFRHENVRDVSPRVDDTLRAPSLLVQCLLLLWCQLDVHFGILPLGKGVTKGS